MLTDEQIERMQHVQRSTLAGAFDTDPLVHVTLKRWVLLGDMTWGEMLEALTFAMSERHARTATAPHSSGGADAAGVIPLDSAPAPGLNGRGKLNGSSAAAGGKLRGVRLEVEGRSIEYWFGPDRVGFIILLAAVLMGVVIGAVMHTPSGATIGESVLWYVSAFVGGTLGVFLNRWRNSRRQKGARDAR